MGGGRNFLRVILFFGILVSLIYFVLGVVNVGVDQGTNINVTTENNFSHLNLTDGSLVFYNPFDVNNISNGTTYDYTNQSNDGTNNGATFNSSGGYYGGAYEFDGSDDYVNIDGVVGEVSGATTGTWSVWVKPVDATPPSNEYFLAFGDTDATEIIYSSVKTDGVFRFAVIDGGTTQLVVDTGSAVFSNNVWTHVAVVQNSTFPVVYVDGVEVSQTHTISTDLSSWFFETTGIDNGRIGDRNWNGGGNSDYFQGTVDEVMIFNSSLSKTEIEQIYNATFSKFHPTGTQNFTDLDFGTNNTLDIDLSDCKTINGSYIQAKVNDGSYQNFSSCSISNYDLSGLSNLNSANLTLNLVSNSNLFYSPVVAGNLTLTLSSGETGASPTYSDAQTNSTTAGQEAVFALKIDDDFKLETNGYYIFSTNNSGSWVNDSQVNFTTTPEWANVTKTLNSTDGQVIGYRWYLYDNAGNFNDTGEFTLTTSGTISVSYPFQYVVYQRHNSTTAEIKIIGAYSGSPSSIEASFNNGNWFTINSSLSGGIFTGTFNASIGQGNLSVRFSDDSSISKNVSDISVGDVFLITGQSNAVSRGNTLNSINYSLIYNSTATYCGLDIRDVTLQQCKDNLTIILANDPFSNFLQGSPYPFLSDYIIENQSIPIGFVQAAVGSSRISDWQKNEKYYDYSLDSLDFLTNSTRKVKAIIFFQGESAISDGTSYDFYKDNLSSFVSDITFDTTVYGNFILGQVGEVTSVETNRSSVDNVRKAQLDSWTDNSNISVGISTYDIGPLSDGVHFKTDGEIQEVADRWWATIGNVIYGVGDGRGPRINNITFDEGDNDTLVLNFTEDSLPLKIEFYNGTSSSLAKGFSFYLDNGTFFNNTHISSTELINQNQLRINLTLNITAQVNVSFGSFHDSVGQPIVRDSSQFSLPTETFYNQTVYMISADSDSTAPTLSILYPINTTYSTNITTLNFTASDETALSKCWYSTDSGTTNSSLNDCTANFSNINATSSGGNTWFVYANDSSDNVNATSVSFTYSAPTSSSSSSSSSSSGSSGTITHSPSSEDVKDGYSRRFQEREKVDISGSDGGKVQVEIIEIVKGDSRVDFGFGGEVYSVRTNSSVKIDTNDDGFYDLEISVNGVINSVYADLTFKEIHEAVVAEAEEGVNEEVVDEGESDEEYGFWKLLKMFFVDVWDWVKGIF